MRKKTFILSACISIALIIIGAIIFSIEKSSNSDELILYGNVDVRQVDMGFRVPGRVIQMPFQEGAWVKKGMLLGQIEEEPYADRVEEAEALVASLQISLENAELILNRRKELIGEGAVSQEELDNATAHRDELIAKLIESKANLGVAIKNYEDTKVYAPNDGVILTRIREPGSVVNASEPIYTLSLLDPVWIRAFVPEPLLGAVYFDMPAKIYTDSKNLEPYSGHIGFISPVAEFTPKTVETTELRTDLVYRLRIIADNPDRYLKQGMPVTIKLKRNCPCQN